MSPHARRRLGDAGEQLVANWYEAAGYTVVDRNWQCRDGELDLVCVGHDHLVFCEVKTRRSTAFGSPLEAVTVTKQRRIRTLARLWLADQRADREAEPDARSSAPPAAPRGRTPQLRFDVAAVLLLPGGEPTIEVVEAAF